MLAIAKGERMNKQSEPLDPFLPEKAINVIDQMKTFVGNINQDLQISTPGKLFNTSPFQKAASALSGFASVAFISPFSQTIANAAGHERSLVEVAAMANVTPLELVEFYQSTPYSLEFIKAAVQAGAKLDEEDIKRTMEERVKYASFGEGLMAGITSGQSKRLLEDIIGRQDYTFTVILPNSDRREVKAAYMEVDGATLYFEDEDHDTILAFGPGHWVWAERVKEENPT